MKYNLNRMFRRMPFVFLSIGMVIGILLGNYLEFHISKTLNLIFLLAILFAYNKWKYSHLIVITISVLIGISQFHHSNGQFSKYLNQQSETNNVKVQFKGTIITIEEFSSGDRITLENIELKYEKIKYAQNFKYIVYPKGIRLDNVSIGDTLIGTGKYQLFKEKRNPGQFDSKKYYNNKYVTGRIYSNNDLKIRKNDNFIFKKTGEKFRSNLQDKITQYSDSKTSALLSALILGYRNEIDHELRESFANVGVVHVFAVSGLHVGYVLLILIVIVKLLRIPWGWNKIIIIFGLIVFSMISGGRPSVIRASLMAGLYVLAPLFNRRPNSWNLIAVAAFIILFFNPNALFDLGFQLSFTAVMSIVFFYSLITKNLSERIRPKNVQNTFIRFVWTLFLVSLSAQLGTIPVVAYYFGRIPIIAIVANIFVIPLIGLFVALGFVKLLFFWMSPLSYFTEQVVWLTKEIVHGIIYIFNQVPFASIPTPQFSLIDLLIYLWIIFMLISILRKQYSRIIIYALLFTNLLIWPNIFRVDQLNMIFLDLGSNEATLIQHHDRNVLINNGVNSMFADDVTHKILPSFKYFKIDEIDLFIKGVGNSNHKIGSVKLLEKIPIKNIWDIGFDNNSAYDSYFKNLSTMKSTNYSNNSESKLFMFDNSTYLNNLFSSNSSTQYNNYCILLMNGECRILLVDQLTIEQFKILIDQDSLKNIDVFKLKYPRELTPEFKELINHLNPEKTIVTGKRTSKNNPTYDDLKNIIPNQLLMTDSLGAIWLTSDGKRIEVKDWK